jgi:LysR family transcriptional regulator, regulator of abg operon
MRLNQIRDLIAVSEAGSLRAAARRIGISQPAMSKSLAELEREFQAQLLTRTSRGVALTAAGRAFVARARVVQGELRKVGEDLAALRGGTEGTVAFGIGPALGLPLLPGAMARFRTQRPQARVRIREGLRNALLPMVRDETLDFALTELAEATEPGIHFRPLFRLELVVAARKGHPLARATSLSQLTDAPWLFFYPPGTGGALVPAFSAAGLPSPNGLVHCESYVTALTLIAQTDLLALVPPEIVDEPIAHRYLQRIAVRESIPRPRIGIFTRADTPLSPTAALMVQALVGAVRSRMRR